MEQGLQISKCGQRVAPIRASTSKIERLLRQSGISELWVDKIRVELMFIEHSVNDCDREL